MLCIPDFIVKSSAIPGIVKIQREFCETFFNLLLAIRFSSVLFCADWPRPFALFRKLRATKVDSSEFSWRDWNLLFNHVLTRYAAIAPCRVSDDDPHRHVGILHSKNIDYAQLDISNLTHRAWRDLAQRLLSGTTIPTYAPPIALWK